MKIALIIDRYSIKRCDRNRRGGGVALYIRETILDKCEICSSCPFLIFAWHRPPNECIDIFHQLEEIMKVLDRENKEIILLGDTNCDILPNHLDDNSLSNNLPIHSMRILEIYNLFGFQQLIETGTRETLLSSTLLDHIAATSKSNIVTSGVYKTSISNHYLVYCVRKFPGVCTKQHIYITTRQLRRFDQTEFINDLLVVD